MRAIITALSALSITACTPGGHFEQHPYVGRLPPDTRVDLDGIFAFSSAGELTIELTRPCRIDSNFILFPKSVMLFHVSRCNRAQLDKVRVIATTPWHHQVLAEWIDAGHLVFRVDWKSTGLDPLADDAATVVAHPWPISGSLWTPNAIEVRKILQLISKANGEFDVVSGGAIPELEVTRFEVSGGELRAGEAATLTVEIANHGPGIAYRVVAITRSSLTSLHGQRLEFGQLKPGAARVRRLRLNVPVSETSPDAMLVLVVGEGNGFSPHPASRRITLAPATIAPVLAVTCSIPSHGKPRPDLDAGEDVVLHCVVDNSGSGRASVELETSVAGATLASARAMKNVPPAGHTSFDVPITIPRDLGIDSPVEIVVSVRDRQFARAASTTVIGVIRKPKLCVLGALMRAQYDAKIAELRRELTAGDLTQAEFDRYDAELVTCLP